MELMNMGELRLYFMAVLCLASAIMTSGMQKMCITW